MSQFLIKRQIHGEPEVCSHESELPVSKKRTQSPISSFARILVLFSLFSLAPTAMSTGDVDWEDLLKWTDKVIADTVAAILDGDSLELDDIKRMVNQHFFLGPNSLSAGEIADLKRYYTDELRVILKEAGLSEMELNSLVPQLANWFESALDKFKED